MKSAKEIAEAELDTVQQKIYACHKEEVDYYIAKAEMTLAHAGTIPEVQLNAMYLVIGKYAKEANNGNL